MPPKKAAPKKAAAKKAAAKKAAPKRSAAKKAPPKRSTAAKKAAPKATATRKVTPKATRKSATSSAGRASASAPRVSNKSSGAANTTFAQWFWQADNNKFLAYDVRQNQVMEDAYQRANGTGVVQMTFNNWNYDIDLDRMVQHNRTTHRERQMKREITKAASASVQKSKESATGKRQRAVQKGKGVVDPLSGKTDSCHVYEAADGSVFQCTLNRTEIANNHNKFYVLQLLEEDSKASVFYLFTRWGRVGVDGQMLTEQFNSLSAAVAAYKKKFRDKTRNEWDDRASFTKVPNKYHLMSINYTGDDDDDGDGDGAGAPRRKASKKEGASPTASKLPKPVQELLKLIGNTEALTTAMKELHIDTKRMPLGKISKSQIKQAYGYLKTIESELAKRSPSVEEATGLFYTLIPHDFGFRRPPLINTVEMLKEKMDLLETLGQLEVASSLLDPATQQQLAVNPLDRAYARMGCDIAPLDKSSDAFKRIARYVKNTHGKTHTSFTIDVDEVFTVARDGEDAAYAKRTKGMSNRCMLWHGSRLTNYMGILSQGLRIAPPEAPVTGYMFGKGVYFADVCSKSANYCQTSRGNTTGLMLLSEVALGTPKPLMGAQYMLKAPSGFDSVKGVGRMCPSEDTAKGYEIVDGVAWPAAAMTDAKLGKQKTSLLYNEFIVYDTAQCKMSYLVKIKCNYK